MPDARPVYAEAEQQLTRAEARMSRAAANSRWKDLLAGYFADLYEAWGKRAQATKYRTAHAADSPR